MAKKTTGWFVGGAIALAGCASGFLLGFWAGTSNALDQVASGDAETRDLRSAVSELQRTGDEVLRRVSDRGRSSSGASAGDSAATDARLHDLTAALEGLSERIEVDRRARKGPGFPAIDSVRTEADLRAAHAFWTREDVEQRYGSPAWVRSSLSASGSLDHHSYPLGSPPAFWLDFVLSEDQVIDVLVSDSGLPPR